MKKEIIIGIGAGFLSYLVYRGYDITPLIILVLLGGFLFVISRKKGLLNLESHQKVVENVNFSFEDIGGLDTPKQELKEALEFLLKSAVVDKMGIRPIKGILLTGPPGTGKTLLAKAAAGYSDAVFIATSGSEFIEMYAGVGAQRVRKLFSRTREMARKQKKHRAIIFIDEIEVLGGKRGHNTSHMEYDQTLNQLLVEMDGLNSHLDVQILLIAATNRPDLLDNALLRPGRFDRQVKVDLPDKDSRLEILKIHCANKPLAGDTDLEEIAASTFGFSGAHLENVTNEAAILALREGSKVISQVHLREAVDKVILGEKLSNRSKSAEILHRVAVHEAGHAIMSEILNPGSVDQITVTSRGNALGYVRHTQKEEQILYTRTGLEKEIMVLLAGSVSEELFLSERSTGAANDFQRAIELAQKIVSCGLSKLGVVSTELLPEKEYFETCQEIIRALEEKTKGLLAEKKVLFQELVALLKAKEKVSGVEVRKILSENQDALAC
ncbi:MAG TPA: AAA family ATPase [Peptococcaceae bacterium]|nr:AAA family ATPase [Peptococcaceae bacterium]HQD53848.1 AAA family ATPase [Peptococcaceae bacterium]